MGYQAIEQQQPGHMWAILTCIGLAILAGCQPVATPQKPPTVLADQDAPAATVQTSDSLQLASMPAESKVQSASWPNWMGPRHDGISTETGWSTDWPKSGLRERWSRQIGIGFSSIAIDGDELYTMGHVEGQEIIYCLHPATGQLNWSRKYPAPLVDNLHEGGPGATPTIDGDYVYTLGRGGQLHCLRRQNGEIVWSKDLTQDLQVELPEWGFTSSPYIHNQQLILEAGRVVSYDKHTGVKQWQTSKHTAGYGSASILTHQDQTLLATLDCDGLRIVTAKDGTQRAFYSWESPFLTNSTTPIVQKDQIFISTGYQIGCGLFRFTDEALEPIYTNREMRNHFNNSILHNGYLYGFDGNSNLGRVVRLTCMNFATGEVAWQRRGFGCGSLMICDDKLIILSEDGTLVAAQATPEQFQELASAPLLPGRCWTVPLLLNGHVYARNAAGRLVCVPLPSAGDPDKADDQASSNAE